MIFLILPERQAGSLFSSLGMQCETGSCIYEEASTRYQRHHSSSKDGFADWLDENQAKLVVAFIWLCLIIVMIIAWIAIRKDKRRSLKRAEEWANDPQQNTGGSLDPNIPTLVMLDLLSAALTPLLTQSVSFLDAVVVERPLVLHFEDIEYYVRMRRGKIKHVLRKVHGLAAPHRATHQVGFPLVSLVLYCGSLGETRQHVRHHGSIRSWQDIPLGDSLRHRFDMTLHRSLEESLTGYRRAGVSGTVSVDGKKMTAGDRFMRRIAGYVQQDDVLPGTSTVFEYLLFNAALRMPRDVTRHQKEKRVFDVVQQLGLAKVAHNFVGDQFTRGLSGTDGSYPSAVLM